jgi:hypothetical protein
MVDGAAGPTLERAGKIRRKADQQVTAHAWMRDMYLFRHALFTTVSLISGLFLIATIMASPQLVGSTLHISAGAFQWIMAIFAVASYSIVVLILAWRFDVRAEQHNQAVRHYTKAAYRASRLIERGTPGTPSELDALEAEYLDDRDLPRIPEKRFLALKKWHLQKVEISRALSRDPRQSIEELEKPFK